MAEVTYYYNAWDIGIEWNITPENMVDGNISTFAHEGVDGSAQLNDGNTCPIGVDLGEITKVEIRIYGYIDDAGTDSIDFRTFYDGKLGPTNITNLGITPGWSDYYDVTEHKSAPDIWTWPDIQTTTTWIRSNVGAGNAASVSKVEIRVTYTEATSSKCGLPLTIRT